MALVKLLLLFIIPLTTWWDLRDYTDCEAFPWVLKSMCLFPDEGIEPVTPMLPEDTGKEDARETFKGNDGTDKTLLGKIDDGTLLITNYAGLHFLLCSFPQLLKKMN